MLRKGVSTCNIAQVVYFQLIGRNAVQSTADIEPFVAKRYAPEVTIEQSGGRGE